MLGKGVVRCCLGASAPDQGGWAGGWFASSCVYGGEGGREAEAGRRRQTVDVWTVRSRACSGSPLAEFVWRRISGRGSEGSPSLPAGLSQLVAHGPCAVGREKQVLLELLSHCGWCQDEQGYGD